MKKLFVSFSLLFGLLAVSTFAGEKHLLQSANLLVWVGLDFSHVRLIGSAEHFKNPEEIFSREFKSWNDLFLKERIPVLEKKIGKTMVIDIGAVTAANQHPDSRKIITSPGPDDTISNSHLTAAKIAAIVKGYDLKNKSGLGVVFIVDRFVRIRAAEGAVYVVTFDLATRKVVSCERAVCRARGWGFRNYWFGVIKGAEKTLLKMR